MYAGGDRQIATIILIINILLEVQIIIVRALKMSYTWDYQGKAIMGTGAGSFSSREKVGSGQGTQPVWRHRRLQPDKP